MIQDTRIKVNHVALGVRDVVESTKFYHEVLGIPILRWIGPKDNPRIVFLEGLELSQRTENEAPSITRHVGMEVTNMGAVVKNLEGKGIQFTRPIREIVFEQEKLAVKIALFQDPDGTTIELVEWRQL